MYKVVDKLWTPDLKLCHPFSQLSSSGDCPAGSEWRRFLLSKVPHPWKDGCTNCANLIALHTAGCYGDGTNNSSNTDDDGFKPTTIRTTLMTRELRVVTIFMTVTTGTIRGIVLSIEMTTDENDNHSNYEQNYSNTKCGCANHNSKSEKKKKKKKNKKKKTKNKTNKKKKKKDKKRRRIRRRKKRTRIRRRIRRRKTTTRKGGNMRRRRSRK